MKIAVFYPKSEHCGWSDAKGIVRTLERMGHKAIDAPMPTTQKSDDRFVEMVKANAPPLEELKACDAILVSGPEHVGPWLDACYGKLDWKQLAVPKAAWVHETRGRQDYELDYEGFQWWADYWFWPGVQDAEFHDQEMFCKGRSHWLPLGVDTEVFKPYSYFDQLIEARSAWQRRPDVPISKTESHTQLFDLAFIGLMYPKRQLFMNALAQHHIPPIRVGQVRGAVDLHGYDVEGGARLLAENYRQVKVFFNLPAMSRMLVSKVTEVMSCGTFLLTPMLPTDMGANRNMKQFEDNVHLVFYRSSNLPYVAQLLREWTSPEKDEERQKIAAAGCAFVREKHSLTVRIEQILAVMGLEAKVKVATN